MTKTYDIPIPERAVVHEDPRTHAQYTAFTFTFPDGYPGTVIITKGMKSPRWKPTQDIDKITIQYNDA